MDTKKATEHYMASWKKYADFTGRAERAEYWYFFIFNFIISIVFSVFDNIIGSSNAWGSGILGSIFSLAVLLPGLAVGVRRLHDIGKSGWFILLAFIPIIGWIWLLILYIKEGDAGENTYGPNPKTGSTSPQAPTQPTPPPQPTN